MSFVGFLGSSAGANTLSAGSGLIGGALGMIGSKRRAWEQYSRQGKLMDRSAALNMDMAKEMAMFNQKLQMDMWEATNYSAQRAQMQKAGLNPALMYGMGGGGGATVNAAAGNAGGVGTPTAPMRESGAEGIAMAMQLAKMGAEIANINADTADKKANIPIKSAQVRNMAAEWDKLINENQNIIAKTALEKIRAGTEQWELNIKNATTYEAIESALAEYRKSVHELEILVMDKSQKEELLDTTTKIKQQELTNMIAQKALIESNIGKNEAEIQKMAGDLVNKAIELGIMRDDLTERQMNNLHYRLVNDIKESTRLTVETAQRVVGDVIEAFTKFKTATPKTKTTETFKDKNYEKRVETYDKK